MKVSERFKGCILGGAIGDAYGSAFESIHQKEDTTTYYLFGKPKEKQPLWNITDDTQLTLATCEAISENADIRASYFANVYLNYFQQRKITGIGASTLKSLRELKAGIDWSLVGRKGEYAAGNGAAMRIAPLAFVEGVSRLQLKEICSITHHNDEAYVGALAVMLSIQSILNETWRGKENLITHLIPQLPDTRVRDRLIEIQTIGDLEKVGKLGNDGYVVNSVPLAIAAANQVSTIGIEEMFHQIIKIGGDTDTNASIAGQIAGTLVGHKGLPDDLLKKLMALDEFNWIETVMTTFVNKKCSYG